MKIIRPTTITDATLTSSSVPETDYTVYSAATTYAQGARVIVTTGNHHIYESLQASNTGHDPATSTDWWLNVSATNRWKAFDKKVADQVSQATSINYVINAGIIDAVALLNIDGTSITIAMTDATEGIVYNKTIDLITTSNVIDFYTYCFEPFLRQTDLALFDLPPYGSASLSITISYTGGTAKVGEVIVGKQSELGFTEYGPSIGIIDYSRKVVDTFGNYTVTERNYSKRLSCNLFLDNSYVDELNRQLALCRATPLVWVAADGFSSLIVYGFYKSFEVLIPYPTQSACSLEIEGLT